MEHGKTTFWGAISAVGLAVFGYIETGGDWHSPAFWAGLVAAIGAALKGYFSADK